MAKETTWTQDVRGIQAKEKSAGLMAQRGKWNTVGKEGRNHASTSRQVRQLTLFSVHNHAPPTGGGAWA